VREGFQRVGALVKRTQVCFSVLCLGLGFVACSSDSGSGDGSTTQITAFILGQISSIGSTANLGGIGASTLSGPSSVYSNGTSLFAADTTNNRILIWNTIPSVNGAGANVVLGQASMLANSTGTTATTLNTPKAVCLAGSKLISVESANNRALVWNSIPTVNGTAADVAIGQASLSVGSAATTAAGLSGPTGCYSDGTKLFIADTANHRVVIYNTVPGSSGVAADVAVGQSSLTAGASATNAAGLKSPGGVFSDGTKLYIADTGNHRVLIYNTVPTSSGASADIVLGQSSMTGGSVNAGAATANPTSLSSPTSVWVSQSKLYVADSGNHRVLVWSSIPTANQAQATSVYGQPSSSVNTANSGSIGAGTLSSPAYFQTNGTKFFVADTANNRIVGGTPSP